MGNASQINRSRNSVRVERRSDLNESDLGEVYCISFRTGVFPSRMKIAKVIPMFKSGTKTDVTNYRPISLLPQFSKILEKLFLTRINSFLIANNILSSSQYGFRTKLSTSLAVMELIEEITNATDNKKTCNWCIYRS